MPYGIFQAREIVRQAGLFLDAVPKKDNAEALAKLRAEDFTDEELAKGKTRLGAGRDALAGSEGGLGGLTASTEKQEAARGGLHEELSGRLRKTRAKLARNDRDEFLLTALNTAVRHSGNSQAALVGRAQAFIKAVKVEHEDPETGAAVTIAERANITDAQLKTLGDKVTAFVGADTVQEGRKGTRMELTQDKERTVRSLDRWLATWQQIAKADFTDAELRAFGIPGNVQESRGRRGRGEKPTPG